MKAIGYFEAGALDRADALIDLDVPMPSPGPQDLLVKVAAISVNPVDTKIRSRRGATGDTPEVLGWDAVGEVVSCGGSVSGFAAGDRVYYAGALERPGSNAEYQLVDARIAAHAPLSLSAAEAAARLGIRGWVRNTADGAVEALAIGTELAIESFVAWCHQGPPKAKVTRVTVSDAPLPDPLPTGFTVAPDA